MIHEEFSNFFSLNTLREPLKRKIVHWQQLHGIKKCFFIIQNRCVQPTELLSRLVIETACQRPATLKDFRTQELSIEMQTWLLELSEFQPIGRKQQRSFAASKYVKKVQNRTMLRIMLLDICLRCYWI